MHVLVAYDISDSKTRGKIFAYLKEKGIHSQKSVFECELDSSSLHQIQKYMQGLQLGEKDSVVFYPLCKRCSGKCSILGQGLQLVQTDWLVI